MRCDETQRRVEERRADLLTPREARAFDEHVAACDACAAEWREATAFEALLDHAADGQRDDVLVRDLEAALESERQRKRGWAWRAVAAAAVLLVAILVVGGSDDGPAALETGARLTLLDGESGRVGRAVLRAVTSSQIEVAEDTRAVSLLRGAVRFQVARGSTPFHVQTPNGVVRVLGTEFEVHVMEKREWIGAGVLTTVLVVGGLVLLENRNGDAEAPAGTVAVMRDGEPPRLLDSAAVTALVEENERLKAELETLRGATPRGPTLEASAEGGATAPTAPTQEAPKAQDPAPTTPEAKVAAAIDGTDWGRMGKALLVILGGEEDMEREPTATEAVERAYVMSRMAAMAAAMGKPMSPTVLLDGRIRRPFLDGLLQAALPDRDAKAREPVLSQLERALGTAEALSGRALLPLEEMAERLAAAAKAEAEVRGDLDTGENVVVLRLLTLLQNGFGRSINKSTSGSVEGLVTSTERSLIERFEIAEADRKVLRAPVERFVQAHREVHEALTRQYGVDGQDLVYDESAVFPSLGDLGTRRARLDGAERFARVQAAMERAIHDAMPAEVQARMQGASIYWLVVRLSE